MPTAQISTERSRQDFWALFPWPWQSGKPG